MAYTSWFILQYNIHSWLCPSHSSSTWSLLHKRKAIWFGNHCHSISHPFLHRRDKLHLDKDPFDPFTTTKWRSKSSLSSSRNNTSSRSLQWAETILIEDTDAFVCSRSMSGLLHFRKLVTLCVHFAFLDFCFCDALLVACFDIGTLLALALTGGGAFVAAATFVSFKFSALTAAMSLLIAATQCLVD